MGKTSKLEQNGPRMLPLEAGSRDKWSRFSHLETNHLARAKENVISVRNRITSGRLGRRKRIVTRRKTDRARDRSPTCRVQLRESFMHLYTVNVCREHHSVQALYAVDCF